MDRVRFGKTELLVSRIAFGGIPIQLLSEDDAVAVVRRAIDLGVNFFDTAINYTDSEDKIGLAIKGVPRNELVLATKSLAKDKKGLLEHVDLSLKQMGTDYIDIYQLHYINTIEDYRGRMGEGGAYEGLMEAIKAGKVRFSGFSSHSVPLTVELMREGSFFDMVQLPFNFVDNSAAEEAIPLANDLDMGFIAMKPFGGGMLDDAGLALRYLAQFESIVPDPGVEKIGEIEEIVRVCESGEKFTEADAEKIEQVKKEVGTTWCHRCNYCQPCPQKIKISSVLTVESTIKRFPYDKTLEISEQSMEGARNCTGCRDCTTRCPYKLDIPELIKDCLAVWDRYKK